MTKHSYIYIFYLTALFFGIQFIWTVEFSAGNPYLLHLGMSKAATPFVWAAGPISGLIVQPLVGYYSDTLQLPSNLKFGRRKPFLVLGTVAVSIGLFLIAYAPLLSPLNPNTSLYIAVGGFYILDFSVNILMASARSLLVDKLSAEDQIMGTSFAGRMLNAGDLCGYFIGGLDLVSLFPFMSSQMRILSWISLIILWISMSITLLFIKEDPISHPRVTNHEVKSALDPFISIYKSLQSMPVPIQKVCMIQFFNWMGWFPFLFYSSTWLFETSSTNSEFDDAPETSRIGSLGLFYFSLISFANSLLLPYLQHRFTFKLGKLWSSCLWFYFSCIILTALYSHSTIAIMMTISLMGMPWFATGWIPFALIGLELTKCQTVVSDTGEEELVSDEMIYDSPHFYTSLDTLSDSQTPTPKCDSGVIMGIHNMYICLPQLLSTLLTSFIFYIFGDGKESLGWTIRFASCFVAIAAWKSWKLA